MVFYISRSKSWQTLINTLYTAYFIPNILSFQQGEVTKEGSIIKEEGITEDTSPSKAMIDAALSPSKNMLEGREKGEMSQVSSKYTQFIPAALSRIWVPSFRKTSS